MAYRFKLAETISDGVRRIAHERLDKALDRLGHPGSGGTEEAVHDVRKRCKELRGLVRLVRPAMAADHQQANAAFRDAARELSPIRDAHALLGTFDDLVAAHVDQIPSNGILWIRDGLAARAQAASRGVADQDARIRRAQELLVRGRSRVDGWTFDNDFDVVCAGAAKTYSRGRKRFADSLEQPSDETFHEWRKRVKDSWYHMRILQDSAPSVLRPLADRLHDLSDVLGDDHNLAVLADQLRSYPDQFGGANADALVIIGSRRADLKRRALRLGARLYVERPSAFARRLAGYWRAWREFGDELAAGEIADLAPPNDDLDGLSQDELHEKARPLQRVGRSSMDQGELAAIIRAAGGVRG
ncbi:MAG: CHAD domain-containing protein [Egibacteraceae bacterium]